MKYSPIQPNFKYPDIPETAYRFGSNQIDQEILREDGDWRQYLPPMELQNKNGVESAACYIEAQQHCIAVIQEEKYWDADNNYSGRYNAIFCQGTPTGGNPLEAGNSFRHEGLIPEEMLPFSDIIKSWGEFCSFKDGDELACIAQGKKWLTRWNINYDLVFTRDENIASKYNKLREALKHSPVPMSVLGWYQDEHGVYVKPEGTSDNHLALCIYLDDDQCPWILDTYEPFLKKLAPFYNSDFAMRWTVNKIMPTATLTLWQRIKNWLLKELSIMRQLRNV